MFATTFHTQKSELNFWSRRDQRTFFLGLNMGQKMCMQPTPGLDACCTSNLTPHWRPTLWWSQAPSHINSSFFNCLYPEAAKLLDARPAMEARGGSKWKKRLRPINFEISACSSASSVFISSLRVERPTSTKQINHHFCCQERSRLADCHPAPSTITGSHQKQLRKS